MRGLLSEPNADLFCDRYGVTPDGNFEDKTAVLNVPATTADLADEHDLDESEVKSRLEKARKVLFAAREGREHPTRDEKVLVGWSSLTISAFVQGSVALEDDSLAADARHALDFMRERLWDAETATLSRRVMNGEVKGDGYLEDYVFLVRGAFNLYQATGDLVPLSFTFGLARATRRKFYDANTGTLYFTPESGESLVTHPQEPTDQSTLSGLGVATSPSLDLEQFAPDAGFGEVADAVLGSFANRVRGSPLEHVSLALAAGKAASGVPEFIVAVDGVPDEWCMTLASRYFPGLVISRRPGTDEGLDAWLDELGLDKASPIWASREAADGELTVYACGDFICSAPTHDLDGALVWFTAGEDA